MACEQEAETGGENTETAGDTNAVTVSLPLTETPVTFEARIDLSKNIEKWMVLIR